MFVLPLLKSTPKPAPPATERAIDTKTACISTIFVGRVSPVLRSDLPEREGSEIFVK